MIEKREIKKAAQKIKLLMTINSRYLLYRNRNNLI